MPDMRECPIAGCKTRHSRNLLMCKTHWHMLPKELRDNVWTGYRTHGVMSEEYHDARNAAIAYVEEAEANA